MAKSLPHDDPDDPTVYPVEERMGEDFLQRLIVELLRPLLQRWMDERGETALVGADQFIYWKQHSPVSRVAPDIYVLPGVAPGTLIPSWKTWQTNVVPSFALEVASRDWEKDYVEGPARYAELGVGELVVFDPGWEQHPDRVRFQVLRRLGGRPLALIDRSNADRVRSTALGGWLRAVGQGVDTRLRIARDPSGDDLFPTAEEAERAAREAERAAKEAERAAKEAERAAKEAERFAKEEALAEIERLRRRVAELEQIERGRR